MSDDKNDEGKKPEDDDIEINIEGFGEDDEFEAGAEDAPKLEEGQLPQDLQDLVDQGMLSEEQAAEMAQDGVSIKVVNIENPEDLEALFGGEAGDLSELFNQKVYAPMDTQVYHKHDAVDHDIIRQQAIAIDVPKRVNPDDIKVTLESLPAHPMMPDQKINVVTIEAARPGLKAPGEDYCPDVRGLIPTDYKYHIPVMTHPKADSVTDKDMQINYSEETGLVITIEATDESIQDQKELIAEMRNRGPQLSGFSM